MTKKLVVEKLAEKLEVSLPMAKNIFNKTLESLTECFTEEDSLQLVNFGTFHKKTRKARNGRNPQTGEPIKIPAKTVVTFAMGKNLSDTINGKTPTKKETSKAEKVKDNTATKKTKTSAKKK